MAHPGLGGLQPHDYVGLGLLPGPLQLLVGGALGQKLPDYLADGLDGLGLGLLIQGGVDAEDPGVGVARPVGVDRVAQPLLLPHPLEEPGGHSPAQDGGEELEGEPPGGVVGQAGEGQGQVVLLDGLFRGHEGRGVGRRGGIRLLPGGEGGKPAAEVRQDLFGKAPRQGHHGVVRPVVAAVVVLEEGPGHGGQGLLLPQDGPGEGGAGVDVLEELFPAQVVGGVLVHIDLLQDDPPLGLHGLLVESGAEDHVPEDIQGLGQVVVQDVGVEAGALLGGEGVHLAADGVGLPGDIGGGPGLGALEEHVLDEVGRAGLPVLLLP